MKVRVFRDSAVWGEVEQWWQLAAHELAALGVASYALAVDEDGDVIRQEAQLTWIRAQHPGCVLVY